MSSIRPNRLVLRLWSLLLGCALLVPWGSAYGYGQEREYEVKAAYLYNYTKFVEYPSGTLGPTESFVIGLIGDPFEGSLSKLLAGKRVGDHSVVIKHIDVESAKSCHVLFISRSAQPKLAAILAQVRGRPILTVADTSGWAERGVMVNMTLDQNRVRFEVNLAAAKASRLSVSARLLGLAQRVIGN